jgi:2-keto-4-pentenoate hydratase
MAEISSLHLGLEFPDSRFADFASAGEAQLIADNACAHKFMMGSAVPDSWRDLDLSAHLVQARVSGPSGQAQTEYDGTGANVLGCPRIAMTWLVNELSEQNITLTRGEFVTTGTSPLPMAIMPGCLVVADFGRLGTISCQLGRD